MAPRRHPLALALSALLLLTACGNTAATGPKTVDTVPNLSKTAAHYLEASSAILNSFGADAATNKITSPSRTLLTAQVKGTAATLEIWWGSQLQTAKNFYADFSAKSVSASVTTGIGHLYLTASGKVPTISGSNSASVMAAGEPHAYYLMSAGQSGGGLTFKSSADSGGEISIMGNHVAFTDGAGNTFTHDFSQDFESIVDRMLGENIPPPSEAERKNAASTGKPSVANADIARESDVSSSNKHENIYNFLASKTTAYFPQTGQTTTGLHIDFYGAEDGIVFQAISQTSVAYVTPPPDNTPAPSPPPQSTPPATSDDAGIDVSPSYNGHYFGTASNLWWNGDSSYGTGSIHFDVSGSYIINLEGSGEGEIGAESDVSWTISYGILDSTPPQGAQFGGFFWIPLAGSGFKWDTGRVDGAAGWDQNWGNGAFSGDGATGTIYSNGQIIGPGGASPDISPVGQFSATRVSDTPWSCTGDGSAPPDCVYTDLQPQS